MTQQVTKIPINFSDEMMTVIAAVIQSANMTADQFTAQLKPGQREAMCNEIMSAFQSIHKKGMIDAKSIYEQGKRL